MLTILFYFNKTKVTKCNGINISINIYFSYTKVPFSEIQKAEKPVLKAFLLFYSAIHSILAFLFYFQVVQ